MRAIFRAAAAMDAPADVDFVILFKRDRFSFDASGRSTHSTQLVVRILTTVGAQQWSSI